MQTQEKQVVIEELTGAFQGASATYFVDYRGCTCSELTAVRGKLRTTSSKFQVVKNTLAKRALKEVKEASNFLDALDPFLKGPTAVVWAEKDPVQSAKVLVDFAKENQKFQLKAGIVDGALVSAADIEALSKMPSKEELQAKLLGLLNTAVAQVLRVVNAPGTQLVRTLEAWRGELEKKGNE